MFAFYVSVGRVLLSLSLSFTHSNSISNRAFSFDDSNLTLSLLVRENRNPPRFPGVPALNHLTHVSLFVYDSASSLSSLSLFSTFLSSLLCTKPHRQVFGNIRMMPETEYNRHNNFQSFIQSLMLLFRWVWQPCCWSGQDRAWPRRPKTVLFDHFRSLVRSLLPHRRSRITSMLLNALSVCSIYAYTLMCLHTSSTHVYEYLRFNAVPCKSRLPLTYALSSFGSLNTIVFTE